MRRVARQLARQFAGILFYRRLRTDDPGYCTVSPQSAPPTRRSRGVSDLRFVNESPKTLLVDPVQ